MSSPPESRPPFAGGPTPALDPDASRFETPFLVGIRGDNLPRRFAGYQLLEEIARGGMGVVYLPRQLTRRGERMVKGWELAVPTKGEQEK